MLDLLADLWYVLPSEPDGRTYQISNIDLLLTECSATVAIFVTIYFMKREHQLTQI